MTVGKAEEELKEILLDIKTHIEDEGEWDEANWLSAKSLIQGIIDTN